MNFRFLRAAVILLSTALLSVACGGAEDRLARYQERGDSYFAEGNFDKARVEFSNVLQIDPKNAQARFMSGQIAERQGNPRDAVGQYQAAIEVDANHAASRAALGRLFLFGGLSDRALELVEAGLALAPDNPQLLTVRGGARVQLGNRSGALEDAEAAYSSSPADEYAIALLASLYKQDAQAERAIGILRDGIDKLPANVDLRVILADLELQRKNLAGAEEQLRKTVEIEPDAIVNWQRLARFYLTTRNSEAAEQAMRNGLKAMPDNMNAKLALVDYIGSQRGAADAEQQLLAFVKDSPADDELKLALGRFYEARGNTDRAEATYQEIIGSAGVKPAGLTARNRIAGMLAQKNDGSGVERLIGEVLKENPRDNDALIMRANVALARNDADGAISDLRAVLRDQPTAVPVMRALARAHVQKNESALAEEVLRSASEVNPQDAATRLDLAMLLLQTNRIDQAKPLLEKLAVEAPDNIQALEALFRVEAAQKDFKAARNTAECIQRARPDIAMGFYLAGMLDEAESKPEAAVTAYERAMQLQPDGAEPLTALVRMELARSRVPQALGRLDAVIKDFPENVVARNLKGEVLTSQKRYGDAQLSFNEAITKAPQWWVPYRGLAVARLASNDTSGAISALSDGMLKANGAPALATDLATLYERTGKADEAIKVYEDMLARSPSSPPAANNLAMLLVSYRTDAASLDRAQKLAEQLATSTDASFVNTRGWVRYKRGEYHEALPLLQQAVDKAPDSPVLRYNLGMAQLKTGDRDSARRNLEVAVSASKPFAGIDEARAALAEAKRTG